MQCYNVAVSDAVAVDVDFTVTDDYDAILKS